MTWLAFIRSHFTPPYRNAILEQAFHANVRYCEAVCWTASISEIHKSPTHRLAKHANQISTAFFTNARTKKNLILKVPWKYCSNTEKALENFCFLQIEEYGKRLANISVERRPIILGSQRTFIPAYSIESCSIIDQSIRHIKFTNKSAAGKSLKTQRKTCFVHCLHRALISEPGFPLASYLFVKSL